ncbi:MAG UNVERIFIED_CONTAM: uroporphyrinogen-III synthase [Anaerolineae bacterium]|jgi:hypothetical protein
MSISLNGKVILNTRAIHQADPLNELLRGAGAIPVNYFPVLRFRLRMIRAGLDQALHDLLSGQFEWLVLTSANTVLALAERLTQMGRTARRRALSYRGDWHCHRPSYTHPFTTSGGRGALPNKLRNRWHRVVPPDLNAECGYCCRNLR